MRTKKKTTLQILERTVEHITDCAKQCTSENYSLIKIYRQRIDGIRTCAVIARVYATKKEQQAYTDFIEHTTKIGNELLDIQIKLTMEMNSHV